MQKAAQLLVVFLLSAIVTLGLATLMGLRIGRDGERPRSLGAPAPGTGTEAGLTAQQLATVGHLREAQDEYLRMLRDHPADAEAMPGLVAVRRWLAGDDPAVLRRQASAYQQMVARGVAPPDHYSRKAMELLASASLQAAAAVESEQRDAAKRANRAVGPATPRGSSPSVRSAFTPPTLPATPAQRDKLKSQVPPGQAGAPPAPPEPPAQPSATPAPQTPSAPPAGSVTPQQPSAGQTAPPPGSFEVTVAVVPPPTTGPVSAKSQGSLAKVACQKKTFVLHGSNGDEEYLTAPNFIIDIIYIRDVGSERLSDFCGLERHLGRDATVWSVPDGDRKIARWMSVVLPSQ